MRTRARAGLWARQARPVTPLGAGRPQADRGDVQPRIYGGGSGLRSGSGASPCTRPTARPGSTAQIPAAPALLPARRKVATVTSEAVRFAGSAAKQEPLGGTAVILKRYRGAARNPQIAITGTVMTGPPSTIRLWPDRGILQRQAFCACLRVGSSEVAASSARCPQETSPRSPSICSASRRLRSRGNRDGSDGLISAFPPTGTRYCPRWRKHGSAPRLSELRSPARAAAGVPEPPWLAWPSSTAYPARRLWHSCAHITISAPSRRSGSAAMSPGGLGRPPATLTNNDSPRDQKASAWLSCRRSARMASSSGFTNLVGYRMDVATYPFF